MHAYILYILHTRPCGATRYVIFCGYPPNHYTATVGAMLGGSGHRRSEEQQGSSMGGIRPHGACCGGTERQHSWGSCEEGGGESWRSGRQQGQTDMHSWVSLVVSIMASLDMTTLVHNHTETAKKNSRFAFPNLHLVRD
jgi:hypothetical protein